MAEPFRLAVRVTPKGGRDAVDGWARDSAGRAFLKVRVSAAAADGAANAAVIALLARTLGTAKSNLRIVSGETARLKLIEASDGDPSGLGQPPA